MSARTRARVRVTDKKASREHIIHGLKAEVSLAMRCASLASCGTFFPWYNFTVLFNDLPQKAPSTKMVVLPTG